ncbi:MAG: Crp/Fnr family transcriptional regulator [Pseudomonadota bacterium]|nr:Crp/Fnr family transcriptional regulator [Pseudomonadota bacterium]
MDWQEDAKTLLRQVYLFDGLTDADLEAVVSHTRQISLDKGQWLFSQGQPAEQFYVVQEGQIALFLLSAGGQEKIVDLPGPGQFFAAGVMFLDNPRYPVNARATRRSVLLALDRRGVGERLCGSLELCRRLMIAMHRRIDGLLADVRALSFQNASQRLVGYLLQQTAGQGGPVQQIVLAAPKHTLAARLGIAPETLSRALVRLQRQGVIEVRGRVITVLQRDVLLGALQGD